MNWKALEEHGRELEARYSGVLTCLEGVSSAAIGYDSGGGETQQQDRARKVKNQESEMPGDAVQTRWLK